jgi:release factor glutamine methyltransferase
MPAKPQNRHSERSEEALFAGSAAMNIRTALKLGIAQLRAASVPSYTLAAELLLLHATGRNRTSLYSHPEDPLAETESQTYFRMLEQRGAGIPTQHLTGKQEFWGMEFEVTPDVLIPRPETEHLIELALDRLALRDLRSQHKQNMSGEGLLLADIGTGSGCIACALAKEFPAAEIYALDISRAALAVAQRNASRLGFSDRIHFQESNLFSAFSFVGAQHAAPQVSNQRSAEIHKSPVTTHQSAFFDLIASNPPYIGRREAATLAPEVRVHEPEIALYGGEEGYELYADLITQSAAHLKPSGILVLEIGHDSLPAVQPLFDSPQWTNLGVTDDLAGIPRVVSAQLAAHRTAT